MTVNRIRVVVLGSPRCGKSAVVVRYLTKRYIGEYSSTGDFLYQHRVAFDGAVSEVEILDTSNCAMRGCLAEHLRWGDAFAVVYSVCERRSFIAAAELLALLERSRLQVSPLAHFAPAVTLLGNKRDLEHASGGRAARFAREIPAPGVPRSRCSATRETSSTPGWSLSSSVLCERRSFIAAAELLALLERSGSRCPRSLTSRPRSRCSATRETSSTPGWSLSSSYSVCERRSFIAAAELLALLERSRLQVSPLAHFAPAVTLLGNKRDLEHASGGRAARFAREIPAPGVPRSRCSATRETSSTPGWSLSSSVLCERRSFIAAAELLALLERSRLQVSRGHAARQQERPRARQRDPGSRCPRSHTSRPRSRCSATRETSSTPGWSLSSSVLCERRSFIAAAELLALLERSRLQVSPLAHFAPAVTLLGNKRDLEHAREVHAEEGQELSLRFGCQFYEVSAAESCAGAALAFHALLREARALALLLPSPPRRKLAAYSMSKFYEVSAAESYDAPAFHALLREAKALALLLPSPPRRKLAAYSMSKVIGTIFGRNTKSVRKKRPSLSI
ncbi:ras family domain-containing protein [Phthorimaea operculella]|nr:ras family domain-containing protein [Phthorimaea operculella]